MALNIEDKNAGSASVPTLQTPETDELWSVLLQDATADFRDRHLERPAWMRGLTQDQIRILFERFQCLLGRRQLRVHRDHVRCSHCGTIVENLAIESKRILESEGRERAAAMLAESRAKSGDKETAS